MATGAENKFYVSATAPATFDQTGYEAISDWTLTPCMSSIPEISKTFSQVDFECLFTGTTESNRGVAAPIPLSVPFKDDPSNAGQILVKTAFDATKGTTAELLSVKVANVSGTQQVYLQAKVFKYGTGERVLGETFMRMVDLVADAATKVEVNS